MRTSVALLTFPLLYLCVAEVQQLENQAGVCNNTQVRNINIVLSCAGGTAVSQGTCEPILTLNEPKANVKDTEEQSRGLRGEAQATQEAFEGITGAAAIVDEPFLTEVILTHKSGFPESETFYPTKGIFTAPVKGAYFFNFFGENKSTSDVGLRLMKNGDKMETVVDQEAGSLQDTATQGMTLHLEEGQQVHMVLQPSFRITKHHHFRFHVRIHIRIHISIDI